MENKTEVLLKKKLFGLPENFLIYKTLFSVVFPRYIEKRITEHWVVIKRILKPFGIKFFLDLSSNSMSVSTTKYTRDPFCIIKGRDFLKLISRSVPINQAAKIFEDEVFCEIIKISCFLNNRKKFLKRRKRLIGANGSTIKALEMATKCYILIQGNTVSCMGKSSGLKQVRKIVEDCMCNIHPVFHIKVLLIKNELSKDSNLKNKSWEKFLPFFKKNSNSFIFSNNRFLTNVYEKKKEKKFLYEKKSDSTEALPQGKIFEDFFHKSFLFLKPSNYFK